MLAGEHRPGAREAGLHLVGDEHDVVGAAPGQQCGQEALGGDDEPALALDRLDDDRGQVRRADLLVDHRDRPARGQLTVGGQFLAELGVAERVGQRGPVDLGCEGAETVLVGHRLGGQRHREVGTPVVGVVERHHRLFAGVTAGDLDGVLDGFGAGVEQRGAFLIAPRCEPVEGFGDRDVPLVGRDHETGVGEVRGLVADGRDDPGGGVTDRGDRDSGAEVDEPVAVDVLDDATERPRRVHGHRGAHAAGDRCVLAGDQLRGPGTRDGGGEMPTLLHGAHW